MKRFILAAAVASLLTPAIAHAECPFISDEKLSLALQKQPFSSSYVFEGATADPEYQGTSATLIAKTDDVCTGYATWNGPAGPYSLEIWVRLDPKTGAITAGAMNTL